MDKKEILETFMQTPTQMYVEIPYCCGSSHFEADGKPVSGKFICSPDTRFEKVVKTSIVTGFRHKETSEVIPKEEYEKRKDALCGKGLYDADEYEYKFASIDDEYEYKKFIASYSEEIEEIVERHQVELEIHEEVAKPTEFVIPMRRINGDLKDTRYTYHQRNCMMREISNQCSKRGVLLETVSHGGFLQYAKIGGEYIMHEIPKFKNMRSSESLVLGLNEALDRQQEDIEFIEREFRIYFNSKERELSRETVAKALESLNGILNTVHRIDAKQKSWNTKRSAINSIEELIEKLREQAL